MDDEQLELDLGDRQMAKVEKQSESPEFFAQGGNGKMFEKGRAGKAESGTSGKQSNSPTGGSDKFASGGSGKMFGKGSAKKAISGQSGKESQ